MTWNEVFYIGKVSANIKQNESTYGRKIVPMVSLLMQLQFFPECALTSTNNMTRKSLDLSKRSSDAERCYVYVARRTAAMMLPKISSTPIGKASKNKCLNRPYNDPCKKFVASWTMNKSAKNTSANRNCRITGHALLRHEKVEKRLTYIFPQRFVENDGFNT